MNEEQRPADIAPLLAARQGWLSGWIRAHAGRALLRMELVEDLAQGVYAQALAHWDGFEWRGERAFSAWLERLAGTHLSVRRRHWATLRRGGGRLLARIGGEDSISAVAPPSPHTGPATLAARREQADLAARALDLLPESDRAWVRSWIAGEPMRDAALARGLSLAAAERARLRSLERLRKVFELVRRGRRASQELQ